MGGIKIGFIGLGVGIFFSVDKQVTSFTCTKTLIVGFFSTSQAFGHRELQEKSKMPFHICINMLLESNHCHKDYRNSCIDHFCHEGSLHCTITMLVLQSCISYPYHFLLLSNR